MVAGRLAPTYALIALACLAQLTPGKFSVQATRTKLAGENGPESQQVHNNYRTLFTDRRFWYLGFAGLLNGTDKLTEGLHEDFRGEDGHWARARFRFNFSEFSRKAITLRWFIPIEERTALQVYDDKNDIERARGPQVDQQICGLHLDYMLHMLKSHNSALEGSTEWSIWHLMNTFDTPRADIIAGSNVYPGDYNNCVGTRLGVYRDELAKVNASAAKDYFSPANLGYPTNRRPKTVRLPIMRALRDYLGPFFGFSRNKRDINMDEFRDKVDLLPMRYCMAAIRWRSWANTTFYKRNLALRTAACLPETCDSSSYSHHADKIKKLVDYQMSNYHSGYYIDHLHCLPDEQSELRNPFNDLSTTLFIVFNVIWISLIILATFVVKQKEPRKGIDGSRVIAANEGGESKWRLYLNSWNARKNFLDFWFAKKGTIERSAIKIKSRDSDDETEGGNKQRNVVDLDPLEGFKFFSAYTVITAHSAMILMASNRNPEHAHYLMSRSWLAVLNVICPAVVDNFFVATGIITSKILYQSPREVLMKPKFWLNFFIYRYIRVVPLYLLANWFLKAGFRFIGAGPFWDYGTSHTGWSKVCQDESWWTVILPSANYKSPLASCLGVGWYLANDIQFCLITPIIIILFLKRPKLAYWSVFALVLTTTANHVRYYYQYTIDARSTFDWSLMYLTSVTDDLPDGYVKPYYRVSSYLIGLTAGYILVQYERGHIRRWPRIMVTHGKKILFLVTYLLVFAPYLTTMFSFKSEHDARLWGAIFSGTSHTSASLICALFLLFICTGHLRLIGHLYRLQFFRPLANTSLSTVLVHLPLLYYHSQTMTMLPDISLHSGITTNFIYCTEAFLISIVVHVLYELPLRKFIFKFMLTYFTGEKQSKPENGSGQHNPQVAKTKIN